jgi:hypothetical protein
MKNSRLLQEYIRDLLKEDYEGAGNYGPYGYMTFGNGKQFIKGLFEPFQNLFGVLGGEASKIFSTAKMAAKVAVGVFANMVPGIRTDFDKTFGDQNQEIKKIKSKYKKFYDAVDDQFDKNSDIAVASFLWNPGLYMLSATPGAGITGANNVNSFFNFSDSTDSSTTSNESYLHEDVDSSEKVPADLMNLSDAFRTNLENNLKEIVKDVDNTMKMSDEKFVAEHAALLKADNTDQLLKKIQADMDKIKNSKKDDKQEIKVDTDQASKEFLNLIDEKKSDLIKTAKEKYRDAYVGMLNSVAEANDDVAKKSKVNDHGLSDVLRDYAEKIKKLNNNT